VPCQSHANINDNNSNDPNDLISLDCSCNGDDIEDIEDIDDDDDIDFISLHPVSTTTIHELIYLFKNSIPIFFTFFIQYLVQILIPTYFSSNLGSIYMSACTLSITTFYLTGPVLINGFSSSLDTLCSTAYGAKHYHKVGHYYIQCTIILLILITPSMIFWSNSNSFFKYITNKNSLNNSQLPDLCASFLSIFTYVAPAVVIFECSKRFLQSQCKFSIPTRIVITGIPISIFFNYYLKKNSLLLKNEIQIPAISFVLTYWLMTISLLLYIFLIDGYQCLPTLKDLKSWTLKSFISTSSIFFQLGIPGILMILSEAFAFQILTFLSTSFPKDQLAAQSIVATLASLAFQPPYAVGICCSTHIANLIGAKSSNYKPAMNAIYILMLLLSIFNFTWFYIFRNQLASLFTNDKNILITTSKLAKIIAINQFLDCFNILSAAIFRGQGRQKIGSILSIISYYLIGIPLEFYLGFYLDWQVFGLWIGLALAVNFLSIVELLIVKNSNWMKIIKHNHKLA
jgi:MATE family multidrug resistance protein